ncbi:MAG: hypothetical protein FWF57_00055 [Defluviitaleaceae bacterium]|nr:hypothetical protein [Defluviitaleaceae bacterium]
MFNNLTIEELEMVNGGSFGQVMQFVGGVLVVAGSIGGMVVTKGATAKIGGTVGVATGIGMIINAFN